MWWLARPQDVHRIEDRVSFVYVERCHVDRDENAVVIINRERTVRLPAAMVAVLMIGPGTRVTHAAINLLANSGTAVSWVGEQGVRMYASGLGATRSAGLLTRQAYLVSHPKERLAVARRMYAMRFPGEDVTSASMQQLRGREGMRIKRLYKQQSARTGVPWSGRAYVPGQPNERGDDVNRVLSLSHGCLYAICHAVITGLGLSPGLGFVHTGNALSFVMDIADLYKGQYTIPIAFDLTAQHLTTERDVRTACRDQIATGHFMAQIVKDIIALLTAGTTVDLQPDDVNVLWDEHSGPVPGGTNWAELLAAEISADTIFGITGPELHPSPAL